MNTLASANIPGTKALLSNTVLTILLWLAGATVFAQTAAYTLNLNNPSFEGLAMHSRQPSGWYDCGKPDESAPDTQPGSWGNTTKAQDGRTYLGLVTRNNDSWESVCQGLAGGNLNPDHYYTFSLYLAKATKYRSPARQVGTIIKNDSVDHTSAVKVRIWGGSSYCRKQELLGESAVVTHTNWKKYNFRFEPKGTFEFITIEAYYKTPVLAPYPGNILIDNASPIVAYPKPKKNPPKPPVAANTPKPKPPVKKDTPKTKPPVNQPPTLTTKGERIIKEFGSPSTIKRDQIIKLESLQFKADSTNVSVESLPVLDELYQFLTNNPSVSIEIGGHTNNLCQTEFCNKLSEERALAVKEYLVERGIDPARLTYRGYGKTRPLVGNASKENRYKNQRVEIKILSVGG